MKKLFLFLVVLLLSLSFTLADDGQITTHTILSTVDNNISVNVNSTINFTQLTVSNDSIIFENLISTHPLYFHNTSSLTVFSLSNLARTNLTLSIPNTHYTFYNQPSANISIPSISFENFSISDSDILSTEDSILSVYLIGATSNVSYVKAEYSVPSGSNKNISFSYSSNNEYVATFNNDGDLGGDLFGIYNFSTLYFSDITPVTNTTNLTGFILVSNPPYAKIKPSIGGGSGDIIEGNVTTIITPLTLGIPENATITEELKYKVLNFADGLTLKTGYNMRIGLGFLLIIIIATIINIWLSFRKVKKKSKKRKVTKLLKKIFKN